MNEEEFREEIKRFEEVIDNNRFRLSKVTLAYMANMYEKRGFQKGKLKQKKEELEFLKGLEYMWNDKGFTLNIDFHNEIRMRIKQLQKEIGDSEVKK